MMPATSTEAFYDKFVTRLLADYASGNQRTERALEHMLSWLPAGAQSVLDIGCGIGWSSSEIARHLPTASVLAVDLSPRLTTTATSMFGAEPHVTYAARDFLRDDVEGRFEAIVLLDVYEHFPVTSRPLVHERLDALLADRGRVILTCPTPEHQRYLREHYPEGLQPVDEDVNEKDLARLAADLGGRVALARSVSVWGRDDYLHAVIERGSVPDASSATVRLEDRPSRLARIRRVTAMRWTEAAGLVAGRDGPTVCIATFSLDLATETFIRAHRERLPANVHVLYGHPPVWSDDGRSLLPRLVGTTVRRIARMTGGSGVGLEGRIAHRLPSAMRARLHARYLKRRRIDVVLAEYGPMAAELYAGCRLAGVPLVPHFHGYDAFEDTTVQQHSDAYRVMFRDGAPAIAVSESMRRQLVSLGADESQVFVNHYGVDIGDFSPGEPVAGRVVAVGRLVEKKAPELLLRAFANARERAPDARLIIAGDGPLRPRVERAVHDLGLVEHVTLKGALNHYEVAKLVASAALFVQHSVVAPNGDREGTPVAVIEAGATGVPVVATRHEGIPEVVVDGETGILVEEGDVAGMGAAIAELLLNPARSQRLGEAARRRVEEHFSMEISLARLAMILDQAAASGADRRRLPERRSLTVDA